MTLNWREQAIRDAARSAVEEAKLQYAATNELNDATGDAVLKRTAAICLAQGLEASHAEISLALGRVRGDVAQEKEVLAFLRRMSDRLNADKNLTIYELVHLGLSRGDPVALAYEAHNSDSGDLLVGRLKAAELELPKRELSAAAISIKADVLGLELVQTVDRDWVLQDPAGNETLRGDLATLNAYVDTRLIEM